MDSLLIDTTSVLIGQHKSYSLYNSELKRENLSSKLEHSSQRALKVNTPFNTPRDERKCDMMVTYPRIKNTRLHA